FVRIVVDVSGYRKGRVEHLENLAKNIRDEVLATNDIVNLSPMTSFERRVIHVCLADFDDVTTESFGEGRSRCVRVSPASGESSSDVDSSSNEEGKSD
ncbi:MAG: R3H domain-containing nucleic acid-binding protein, partial [Patescibacteria group bacterium]|nr:R3H domain-containing nucleic acid-binding protein [Patescibacteria group bacterium]